MSELNMSLEYLPVTKELRNLSAPGKSSTMWLEQSSQDFYNNPRFQLSSDTTCTMQVSRNGKWFIAFIRTSERVGGEYHYTYYKAFAAKESEDYEENNSPVYFDKFNEWMKDEVTGKWVQK